MKLLLPILLCCLAAPSLPALGGAPGWERSVVRVEADRISYSFHRPWARTPSSSIKNGLVIEGRRILTTSNHLYNHTLARVQKGGRGPWFTARLTWIDYHANLATLAVDEEGFWEGLEAASLAVPTPSSGPAEMVRWNDGRLETRSLSLNRVQIRKGMLSYIDLLCMEIDAEIEGIGWSEVLVLDGEVIGLVNGKSGEKSIATPSSFIHSVLEARRQGAYRGLGFFNFYWEPSHNPANLLKLGLEGPSRGVILTRIPPLLGEENPLRTRDILLEVDGFAIDSRGDYPDPDYGPTMFEYLATRGRWAGDAIPMKVWRDGGMLDLEYVLPQADYETQLIPSRRYDRPPEYYIAGGLLFQPMSEPFLQAMGGGPVRQFHYQRLAATPERPRLVVLAGVLPDGYNLGYRSLSFLVVDTVNGRPVGDMKDLAQAFLHPQEGYHVLRFHQGDPIDEVVLDAGDLEAATRRVASRFGLPRASYIHE